ncbi:hypothetical protein GQ600_17348 [Phytophthora cactorum]|nr:hypothetical protein GQ600_17348 [Phytophthora cactorum]
MTNVQLLQGEEPADVAKNANFCDRQAFCLVAGFGNVLPLSKVLLCQSHALVYWNKILGTKFGLTPADRDIAQQCFANMLYRCRLYASFY